MSKFGKFGGDGGQSTQSGSRDLVEQATSSRASSIIDSVRREVSDPERVSRIVGGKPVNVAIALDATGSMDRLLARASESIAHIIERVADQAKVPVIFQLFAYRDYDVPGSLLELSPRSDVPRQLVAWLKAIRAHGGGANSGEAVEVALQRIVTDGDFTVALLAGDEPSNPASEIPQRGGRAAPTARDLARELGKRKTPVHTFVVGSDPRTIADFAAIAAGSGGKTGKMDGSAEMIDLAVLAILSAIVGEAGVRAYAAQHVLTDNAKSFAVALLGPSR